MAYAPRPSKRDAKGDRVGSLPDGTAVVYDLDARRSRRDSAENRRELSDRSRWDPRPTPEFTTAPGGVSST